MLLLNRRSHRVLLVLATCTAGCQKEYPPGCAEESVQVASPDDTGRLGYSVVEALNEVSPVDQAVVWGDGAPAQLVGTETRIHIDLEVVDGTVDEIHATNNNLQGAAFLCSDHFHAQVRTTWRTDDQELDEVFIMSADFFGEDGSPGPIIFEGAELSTSELGGHLALGDDAATLNFGLGREAKPTLQGSVSVSSVDAKGEGVAAGKTTMLLRWE